MSSAEVVGLLCAMAVLVGVVGYWQRVWEPDHAVLLRELAERREQERRRRQAGESRPVRQLPLLAWMTELRDLERSLVIAGRAPEGGRFLLVQLVRMAVTAAALLLANVLWLSVEGSLLVDWTLVALLVLVAVPLLGWLELRAAVRRTRAELGRAFRDMLDLLAVQASGTKVQDPMRDPSEIRPGDWISGYARWRRDPTLRGVIEGNRWRLLTQRRPRTAAEWFDLVADEYGVPEARVVGRILRLQRERGPDVAEEYLREARRLSKQLLAERQVRSRRDRLAHTVASVGLLAAFFALLILAASSVRL
jgi:hypothetical protein